MKTPKFLYLLSGILFCLILVISCQDDFSEKDFLKLQADLAAKKDSTVHQNSIQEILYAAQVAKSNDSAMAVLQKMLEEELIILQTQLGRETDSLMAAAQLEQLRNAGLLLSWSVQVQENRKPVSGADVTVQTADIDNLRTLSATTNAAGYVTFNDVTVGNNLLRITKNGYLTSNVAVQFEMNDLLWTGSSYIPIRRSESSIIPLFSSSTGETATIKGAATVDTDLTNNTRELAPAGTRIKANIAEALQQAKLIYPDPGDPTISSTQRIMSYAVEGGENVGVGTVDASGNFSIIVPALSEGVLVSFIYDNFESTVTQAMMYDEVSGQPITPAYVNRDRFFGPEYDGKAVPVQWVPGAYAEFPAPPSMVTGFDVNAFTPKSRSLSSDESEDASTSNPWSQSVFTGQVFTQYDINYWVKSRGSKLSKSPVITISGGNGSNAQMEAWLLGKITGIVVADGGSGYPAGANFHLNIYWLDGNFDEQYINGFDIFIGTNGRIPSQIDLPTIGDNGAYGLSSLFSNYGSTTEDFKVRVSDDNFVDITADVNVDVTVDCSIAYLSMTNGGNGFTSSPSITFNGGGAGAVLPEVQVTSFATRYSYVLDNTFNLGSYVLAPMVRIFLTSSSTGEYENSDIHYKGGIIEGTRNINELLTVRNGDVEYITSSLTFETMRSAGKPFATVENLEPVQASGYLTIDTNGKITNLTVNETGTGYITNFDLTVRNTIASAPGTGAAISLTDFTITDSGEHQWSGNFNLVSRGDSYLQNLNYPFNNSYNFTAPGNIRLFYGNDGHFPQSVTVFPGNTYQIDVYYGTGAVPDAAQLYGGFNPGL